MQKGLRSVVAMCALSSGAFLLSSASAPVARSAAQSAFVRVNQVGYPADTSKRAYLMASAAETGATFSVKNRRGQIVDTGAVGASLGSWSKSYPFVYPLDFAAVTRAGTYALTVSGPIPASSPSFQVDSGASVYGTPLANALAFYQAERDGPDFIPSALRTAPGHLNDGNAMTYLTPKANPSGRFSGDLTPLGVQVDASGGWWDAGDYLKFLQIHSYTVGLLLTGVRDFPAQMGSAAPISNFTAEARFGTDWLQRMWDDSSGTLYYQVGIGEGNATTIGDHDVWRLPQDDDTFGGSDPLYRYIRNRPVFRAGPAGSPISPNLAGRDAASLGLCYQVYKASDPAYANRCLLSAEHIFDLANTAPKGNLLTAIPYSFYPETEWRDDLEWGATELARALQSGTPPAGLPHSDPLFYLQRAAHWANAYITGPNDAADTLNLYDVSGLAHYELYKALGAAGNPGGLETSQAALLADLKKQLDRALAQAATDPFQFGFPWATWDTTSHGAGLAVMASEYDELTGTQAYADWSGRWLANILGANAWGTSLIVGDGTTFPHCMQHQVANLVGSSDGTPPLALGAVVNGPNGADLFSGGLGGFQDGMVHCPSTTAPPAVPKGRYDGSGSVYLDDVRSWQTDEPALDMTGAAIIAAAAQLSQ
jgi:endoglucanase